MYKPTGLYYLTGINSYLPEQLHIKAVTGACKLIDGCSNAALRCVRPQFKWYQLAYSTEIMHESIVSPCHEIVSFTLHYIQ